MSDISKVFNRRRRIKNLGVFSIFLIPVYIYILGKMEEYNLLTSDQIFDKIFSGMGIFILFFIICMVQFRCPKCGHPLNPRKFLLERCPNCDSELEERGYS